MFLNPTHITQEWTSGWSACACLIFKLLSIKLYLHFFLAIATRSFKFFSATFFFHLIHLFSSNIILLLLLLFCDYMINPSGKILNFPKMALVNRMGKMFKQKSEHLSSRVKQEKAYTSPEWRSDNQGVDLLFWSILVLSKCVIKEGDHSKNSRSRSWNSL